MPPSFFGVFGFPVLPFDSKGAPTPTGTVGEPPRPPPPSRRGATPTFALVGSSLSPLPGRPLYGATGLTPGALSAARALVAGKTTEVCGATLVTRGGVEGVMGKVSVWDPTPAVFYGVPASGRRWG